MQYWLVKQEPTSYSWQDFLKDKRTAWTGVRNYQARNNLKAMKKGDTVLYYHSVTGKEVAGIAKVAKESYPDPTAKEGDWVSVDLVPDKTLKRTVTLDEIKTHKALANMVLVKNSRLSVQPVTAAEFEQIMALAK